MAVSALLALYSDLAKPERALAVAMEEPEEEPAAEETVAEVIIEEEEPEETAAEVSHDYLIPPGKKAARMLTEDEAAAVNAGIDRCYASLDQLAYSTFFEDLGGYELSEDNRTALVRSFVDFVIDDYHSGIVMLDLYTGEGFAYNAGEEFYSASSIKAPYIISVIAQDPGSLEKSEDDYRLVAETSDNDVYAKLVGKYGKKHFKTWCREAGVDAELPRNKDYMFYSTETLSRLWLRCYRYFVSDEPGADVASELFENPEYSAIRTAIDPSVTTQSKAGWVNTDAVSLVDAGIIYSGDSPYLAVVMTDAAPELLDLVPVFQEIDRIHSEDFD